jgi:hypothetical protein
LRNIFEIQNRFFSFSRLELLFVSFVLALAFSGCLNPFAPREKILGQAQLIVTQQKTPEEVLQNFRYAYVFKDSLLYSNLLDSSFIFVYFDPSLGTSGQFVSWGRDLDLKTTGRLFRRFDVIDLVWNSTIYESVQEATAELSKSFDLTLMTSQEDIRITGNAVFSFRKSPYDHKWRIVRWKDESNL